MGPPARTAVSLAVALALLAIASCEYRPARFAGRPPVGSVADDAPIPVPRTRPLLEAVYYPEVYLRRELVGALDPSRHPYAADANSLDQVPRSSWYDPVDPADPWRGYVDGPPLEPLTPVANRPTSGQPDATVVVDARGLRYELQPDLPMHPEVRTAAAAVSSRLLRALGYRTPEVWITTAPQGWRVSATRWPVGVDLGPTPMRTTRPDDPNDVLPHPDRRSLRSLGLVAAWLQLTRLPPRLLRDVYVGSPGHGHVQHHIVGLDGALGAATLLDALDMAADPDREEADFFFRLGTLGLSPKPEQLIPRPPARGLGWLPPAVAPGDFSVSPPFEPFDRIQAADAYWVAKRLAALPDSTIDQAIADGKLYTAAARSALGRILRSRRRFVVGFGYEQTTPCELLDAIRPGGNAAMASRSPVRLVVVDLAIQQGYASPGSTQYEMRILDERGDLIAPEETVTPSTAVFAVAVPGAYLLEHDYVVVSLRARRGGTLAPRSFDIHLQPAGGRVRLMGLRH